MIPDVGTGTYDVSHLSSLCAAPEKQKNHKYSRQAVIAVKNMRERERERERKRARERNLRKEIWYGLEKGPTNFKS